MKIKRKCLHCKKGFFAPRNQAEAGRAKFCSLACKGAYAHKISKAKLCRQSRSCLWCRKRVHRYPSQFAVGRGRYCSHRCHFAHRSALHRIRHRCRFCRKKFTFTKSDARKRPGIYCSKKCAAFALRKREKRFCFMCGVPFETIPCLVEKGGGKFCSCECALAAQFSRRIRGNMIYTPWLLRTLMIDTGPYCSFPGCLRERSQKLHKKTPWRVCKLHADRISSALMGQRRRRRTVLRAEGMI